MPEKLVEIAAYLGLNSASAVKRTDSAGVDVASGTVDSVSLVLQPGHTDLYWAILNYSAAEPVGKWLIKAGVTSTLVDFIAGVDEYSLTQPEEETAASAIAAAVVAELAGITLNISSPLFSGADGETLTVIQGDDYTDDPATITIESDVDLTPYKYVIAARLQSNTSVKFSLEMSITGTVETSQQASFDPAAEVTEAWTAGTYEVRHRIKYGANKYKTIKKGVLQVQPFDTPEPATVLN